MMDISILPNDNIKLLLTKHAVDRFTERFNTECDIDKLNSSIPSGYFLDGFEKRVYFNQYNMLISIDDYNLLYHVFAVKTFIPRDGSFIHRENGIKVNVEWGLI